MPIAFRSKGNMPHFRKPAFISPTVIDSHSSFERFCGNGLTAVDWFLPLSVESFRFWVILLKDAFNEWNMTTFSVSKTIVVRGVRQHIWSLLCRSRYDNHCNRILMMLYFLSLASLPHQVDQFVFQPLAVYQYLLFLWFLVYHIFLEPYQQITHLENRKKYI